MCRHLTPSPSALPTASTTPSSAAITSSSTAVIASPAHPTTSASLRMPSALLVLCLLLLYDIDNFIGDS